MKLAAWRERPVELRFRDSSLASLPQLMQGDRHTGRRTGTELVTRRRCNSNRKGG